MFEHQWGEPLRTPHKYKNYDLVYRSEFIIDSREWKLWLERVSSYLASGLVVQRSLIAMIILLATVTFFRALNLESHMNPLHSKCFALPA